MHTWSSDWNGVIIIIIIINGLVMADAKSLLWCRGCGNKAVD